MEIKTKYNVGDIVMYVEISSQTKFTITGLVTILKISVEVMHRKGKKDDKDTIPFLKIKYGFKTDRTSTNYKWTTEDMILDSFDNAQKLLEGSGFVALNEKTTSIGKDNTDYDFLDI